MATRGQAKRRITETMARLGEEMESLPRAGQQEKMLVLVRDLHRHTRDH